MSADERNTWKRESIAPHPPFGATIVVWRELSDTREFLLLHRAHIGPDYEGEWAWTPPSTLGRWSPAADFEA
jgi:hypothetical protein